MKQKKKLINIIIALCVIGFFLTIFDFLALHDINKEYVSTRILNDLNITLSAELPEWTSTRGEWNVVRFNYVFRFVFFVFCFVVLYKLTKK